MSVSARPPEQTDGRGLQSLHSSWRWFCREMGRLKLRRRDPHVFAELDPLERLLQPGSNSYPGCNSRGRFLRSQHVSAIEQIARRPKTECRSTPATDPFLTPCIQAMEG